MEGLNSDSSSLTFLCAYFRLNTQNVVSPGLPSNGCRCTRVPVNGNTPRPLLILIIITSGRTFSPPTDNIRHHRGHDLSHRAQADRPAEHLAGVRR